MDFFNTHISTEAIEGIQKVLQSKWISEGLKVREFESKLSCNLGLLNPVALNSGTSALHLGLVLSGVRAGDEVIIPAQTFVATGLVVLMQSAIPVFADIDSLTGNISVESISEKITSKTKAIIPVHWGGYPCDLDEINHIAKQKNIAVIEDAAHALGATYKNRPIGSISRLTAFSFQAIKHVTTGDGGALCCSNDKDAKEAVMRRWFGIDRVKTKPSILGERKYDIQNLGYKYHMNDISAALGIGNLKNFSLRLSKRHKIAAYYKEKLCNVPGLQLLKTNDDRTHAFWLFTLLVEKRNDFIRKLSEQNIPSSVVHLRIDRNTIFGGARDDLPEQEYFNEHQVSIPVHEMLNENDIDRITSTIRSGW